MKKKNNSSINKRKILTNFIALLAIANLVLLFAFDYNVPGISNVITTIENNRDHIEGVQETVKADTNITFSYDADTYVYDGKKAFDGKECVKILDPEGNELDKAFLTYEIAGENNKSIVYDYKSEDGQYYGTDTHPLELKDYEGPEITLTNAKGKTVTDETLGKMDEVYEDCYKAKDGYGKDITEDVKIIATPNAENKDIFDILFTVTNQFGDTAQNKTQVNVDFDIPHLKLSEKEINIERGKAFDPATYILYAVDYDGNDLLANVEIDNGVDIDTLGDYEVTYNLSNNNGDSVKPKILTVHVVDR